MFEQLFKKDAKRNRVFIERINSEVLRLIFKVEIVVGLLKVVD